MPKQPKAAQSNPMRPRAKQSSLEQPKAAQSNPKQPKPAQTDHQDSQGGANRAPREPETEPIQAKQPKTAQDRSNANPRQPKIGHTCRRTNAQSLFRLFL